jgi:creatinine amidohydrolase/Fe(II)-dependent formamide hydrolase-like protein
VAATDYPQALQRRGFGDDEIGTHAGLADTSLALAVDPGLVRMDVLRSGAASANADGVRGDPRRSTAELGQLGIDAIVTRTADAIRRSVARRH